jgi:hypothetical protein
LNATRASAASAAPKRLLIIHSVEGYRQGSWKPSVGSLLNQALPKTLSPLEAHKADLIVLPGLSDPSVGGCTTCGHGAYGTVYYGLSNVKNTGEYKEPNGRTVDQVIGDAMPANGRPTLPLAVQIDLPPSTAATGSSRCFWRTAGQPINPEMDPYKTYHDIFGAPSTDVTASKKLLSQRKSILDYVGRSLDRFKAKLGTEDRDAMDSHQQSIRQLETQLDGSATPATGAACGGTSPGLLDVQKGANYLAVLNAQMDLMVAALRCGITRVATLQLADATGDSVNFGAFVPGIPATGTGYKSPYRNWHDLGHNPVLNNTDHKQIVDQWWMLQFAGLISKLKAAAEPTGGTLFDNSAILWGNVMEEGNNHNSQAIPWMLAGKCGGYFNTGQCASSAGKPLASVLGHLCQAMGVASHPFGTPMAGLAV